MPVVFCEIESPRATLAPGETHVYACPIEDMDALSPFLTEQERERAARFRVDRMRQQFIVARGRLRWLLGHYLGEQPGKIALQYEENGKPHVREEYGLQFNLSHADAMVVFAFGRTPVGIDIERVRTIPDAENLVTRFFSKRECEAFQSIQQQSRPNAFLRAWTRKEAVLKAIGRGVLSLDTCEVSFEENEPAVVRYLDGDATAGSKWLLHTWEPSAEYFAAVASLRDGNEK